MTAMQPVFICSPYAGDIRHNTKKAIEYCRYAVSRGVVPIAPHLLMPRFLREANPKERELGIQMGLRLLSFCSELWVFGDRISAGMSREIAEAKRLGIPARYITDAEIRKAKEMKQDGRRQEPGLTEAVPFTMGMSTKP